MELKDWASACCIAALLSSAAQATVIGPEEGLAPSTVLLNADGSHNHWNGVGRIASKKGMSCTATLLDTRSPDSPPDAPAYVLTAGHCMSRQLGAIITDSEIDGAVQFNYFTDTQPQRYRLKRINWSSMQGMDLAIVELEPTLQSLISDGIRPLRLADALPAPGDRIVWVGAPLDNDTGHLRMANCVHEPSAEILSQPWVWRRSVSNRCKDVDTGASGSPLLIAGTHQIYAVLNLVTLPASPDVSLAEDSLPPGFPPLAHGANFGMPATHLNQCFVNGTFSTDPAQCSLFPTFSTRFDPDHGRPKHQGKVRIGEDGQAIYPQWNLRFTLDTAFYRHKTAASALDCENPVGYGQPTAAQEAIIDDPVDGRIGINWLCIIGLSSVDERPSLGLMRNALTLAMELQPAGPTPDPDVTVEPARFNAWSIRWALDSSRIDHYTVKIGPPETTDCSNPQGFKRRFGNLVLRAQSLPKKICTYAHDVNGQRSDVREDIIGV